MCPGNVWRFCGVRSSPYLPSLDDFFLRFSPKETTFRIESQNKFVGCMPLSQLFQFETLVGLGRCRFVGVAMFSWDFDCSDCEDVVTNFSTFLALWRSAQPCSRRAWYEQKTVMTRNCDINWYKGQKFLDVSIMLNHESMFRGFLPCDTNCIWSDLTLSQLSAGPINQNSACFATNGIHEVEESWASWQTETIRHNPRRIPREVLAKILFWNFRQVQHCGGDRGCLESQGLHDLKHWSIDISWMPEALKSLPEAVLSRHEYNQTADVSQDFSQWV